MFYSSVQGAYMEGGETRYYRDIAFSHVFGQNDKQCVFTAVVLFEFFPGYEIFELFFTI